MRYEHLTYDNDGIQILIPFSKTDQKGEGRIIYLQKRDDSELELQSLIKEHPIYKKAEMEFDKVEIISIEEVPKLSIVSNENNDKVKDK